MTTAALVYLVIGGWWGGAVVARVRHRPGLYPDWVFFGWTTIAWPWLIGSAIYRSRQERIGR